jgi:dTDP-4-dehydrorhamnose 3,5-epimerase-like enzyme
MLVTGTYCLHLALAISKPPSKENQKHLILSTQNPKVFKIPTSVCFNFVNTSNPELFIIIASSDFLPSSAGCLQNVVLPDLGDLNL